MLMLFGLPICLGAVAGAGHCQNTKPAGSTQLPAGLAWAPGWATE